jgi:hypothetical protein
MLKRVWTLLFLTTLASSSLLFTGSVAGAQTARATIADTPIRAEANLSSPIIATLKEGAPVDVVDLEGDWYRVLVPHEQGRPRVGYVLAHLIEIVNTDGSSQSIPAPATSRAARPTPQGASIPPTRAQLDAIQAQRKALQQVEVLQAELNALQNDPAAQAAARPPFPPAPEPAPILAPTGVISQTSIMQKSRSGGFFIGTGFEGNGIVTNLGSGSTTESGAGGALVLGYGFTPRWSLYGELSAANINGSGGGTYSLAHVDVGARVHFLTRTHTVVPFVQFGLSRRGEAQTSTSYYGAQTFSASGAGVFFGGGANVHVTPAFAFSGGVTWSVGDFSTYTIDNQSLSGPTVSATSARVHLGVIWFPRAVSRPSGS